MELRDFAEQILFATTLEVKLRVPEAITDERPGPAIATPLAPGRPAELRFKPSGSRKADFPGTHRLEQEAERGRLLHFFANHELLATELMALVLLRFPEAPPAFRRGVLQTLQDEQEHTRLYLDRMQFCGIEFGQLPVSGYFWRAISGMESPVDYVAGLSLTFEQANLDFARHFARAFAAVGDEESARLLDRIHRDEIAHVASGLKWFRRWKNPEQSDWEAFCRQLKFPLSPQRAKGPKLDVEGRRAAGLDSSFIDELNVFSQSKGRTPSVFVFNPLAEGHIAHGKSFTPPKPQAQLARDLENLPQFLCRQDDIVLVEQRPSVQFLSAIKQAGFALPEFVEVDRSAATPLTALAQRKLSRLQPWALGPDSLGLLEPLFANVSGEDRTPTQCFNEGIAQLYSKAWSAGFLRKVLSNIRVREESWLCTEDDVGVSVTSLQNALSAIAAIRARGHHKVVVKEALGLAGRNAIRLWEPELLGVHRRWMESVLGDGRQLVIEPWLEREVDFSVQVEMTPRGLRLCGYTSLINDLKGQFQANCAAPNYDRRMPAAVTAPWTRFDTVPVSHEGTPSPPSEGVESRGEEGRQLSERPTRLHCLYVDILSLLETEVKRAGYLGPLGIDAFVYRDAQGKPRLKPVVEINPRYTMGRLALELMRQTAPGSHGQLRLINRTRLRAEGFANFPDYAAHAQKIFPLQLEGEPIPRISEGVLCLNDPARAQVCLAVFRVSRGPK